MLTLKEAQEFINKEIDKVYIFDEPKELYEPINYILKLGGKRIRPALAILACNLFSNNVTAAIHPAIGMEIFHNFSLLHDDIMDNANVRRGNPTVNTKWNNNIAILSGDAMCIKAYEFVGKCDDKFFKKVFEIYNKTALQVCEGQQYDMNFETVENVTINEYMNMIALKTSVLIAACIQIGAIIGNAPEKDAQLLYQFGLNMGLAFQLQDDLLDVFGDEVKFGKEIGKDIISNKKTYLLIKALELAKGASANDLKHWLNIKKFNADEKITAVQTIYLSLGIKDITQKAIEEHFMKALDYLKQVNVAESNKIELKNFLLSLKNRNY